MNANAAALAQPDSMPIEHLLGEQLPAAAGGDHAAYARIVAACQNPVTAIALAIVRDVPASEDIAQEAFLRAWQNLRRLQNPASFLPWLRQITRNLARDRLRAHRQSALEVLDADHAILAAADPRPSPCEQVIQDERAKVAAELISALPDDSREVVLLYYREDHSSQQVAALLGLTDAAVRKRLSRARASVREDLLERFGQFARASAPTAGFTAMVASALGIASPPAAAAGIFASATAAAGAKTAGQVLLGAAGSIGIGLAGAFAGIWLGLRGQLKGAIDPAERAALIRSGVVSGLACVGFLIAMVLVARYDDGWRWATAATIAFMAVVFHQAIIVQPRILARRHALQALHDPLAAARRRRRERIVCWLGAGIGFASGFGGLLYGLFVGGRF